MERGELITVDEVLNWAQNQGINLGKNPRRMLIYLAGRNIIPKTTKGPNCKGVYKRSEVLSRLSFYHNRRLEGWRIQDIKTALSRLAEVQEETPSTLPIVEFWKRGIDARLLLLPEMDEFRKVFAEYYEKNPEGVADLIHFLDEQEMLTGVKIGTVFRQMAGVEHFHHSMENQTHLKF